MNVDKGSVGDRQEDVELGVRSTISGYGAWCRRNRLISLLRTLSLLMVLAGIGRSHGSFVHTPFTAFHLTLNTTTATRNDGPITLILPPITASLPHSTSPMASAANQTLAPFVNTTDTFAVPSSVSSISPNMSLTQAQATSLPTTPSLELSAAPVTPSESSTTPITSLWTSATSSPISSDFSTSSPAKLATCISGNTTCPSSTATPAILSTCNSSSATCSFSGTIQLTCTSTNAACSPVSLYPGTIMEQSTSTTSTSLTGLLASVLYGFATSTPPSAAEVISSLNAGRPGSTGSAVAVFSVYWPSSTSADDGEPLTTMTSGENSADATATSGVISITTNVDPAGYPAMATTTGTTFSTSLTGSPTLTTSATPANSIAPANSTGPPTIFGHGRFGHGPGPAAIAVPMVIGTLVALVVLTLLWRKYHADSFHKILDAIPGLGCFARWRKTREKNKQVRRMRSLGILTGDNPGDDAPGSIGATTYHRHLKKFEDDAARAREKRSMDTPTRTPASPYTPGRKSKRSTSITALPKFGSPWKSDKPNPSSEVLDTVILTASPARSTGPRVHGPYKRTYDKAETGSLASWEEKWHAFGKEDRKSESTATSTTPLQKEDGHGMQKTDEPKDESGPGQSWRKLI